MSESELDVTLGIEEEFFLVDPDTRIRIMTALRRHLPLLHALSASSPFNGGRETGFKLYRLTIMGALPRTSVPGPLLGLADFERVVASYQRMNFIEDSSELWWDIRPSHNNPTVELRICDVCPRIEDAVSIAALYASLIRWLMRLDRQGLVPPEPPTEIIIENRWLAQPTAYSRSSETCAAPVEGWTSRTMPLRSSRRWRKTPPPSAARPSCSMRSPSSTTEAAQTAR